jgi:endonuclease/exonuclease/phosphatase family metal-dependent hydrolase
LCEGFPYALGLGGTTRANPSGLVTVARHPLRTLAQVTFRGARRDDVRAGAAPQKGLVLATARTPFGEVDVCNVHLSIGDAGRKRAEIAHLQDVLAAHATGNPLVLAGDFNFPARSELFAELERTLGVTCASAGAGPTYGGPRSGIVAWPEPPMTIDHVFVRDGRTLALLPEDARVVYDTPLHDRFGREVHASDHNGVLSEIAVAVTT